MAKILKSAFVSSYQAVGVAKSLGLASPFAPIGPKSGSLKSRNLTANIDESGPRLNLKRGLVAEER